MKGIIALDIDGTITSGAHSLAPEVKLFLEELIQSDWQVIFITGRTLSFARSILEKIEGEFAASVQNGAALYDFPSLKPIVRYTMSQEALTTIGALLKKRALGFLVEVTEGTTDYCYFRISDFSAEELEYLQFRRTLSPETWVEVASFSELNLDAISVIKVYLNQKEGDELNKELVGQPFSLITLRDPFRKGFYLAQITEKRATKESILAYYCEKEGQATPCIVAGDDFNDKKMLQMGKVRIVMADAPPALLKVADIVAPSAHERGIIPAIKEAIARLAFIEDES